ncbi:MAG TPA: hypothetical protein VEK08_13600 [Planctomycetota bacterium]|nr:hypothetical protein [Planctomycetota bacterium]
MSTVTLYYQRPTRVLVRDLVINLIVAAGLSLLMALAYVLLVTRYNPLRWIGIPSITYLTIFAAPLVGAGVGLLTKNACECGNFLRPGAAKLMAIAMAMFMLYAIWVFFLYFNFNYFSLNPIDLLDVEDYLAHRGYFFGRPSSPVPPAMHHGIWLGEAVLIFFLAGNCVNLTPQMLCLTCNAQMDRKDDLPKLEQTDYDALKTSLEEGDYSRIESLSAKNPEDTQFLDVALYRCKKCNDRAYLTLYRVRETSDSYDSAPVIENIAIPVPLSLTLEQKVPAPKTDEPTEPANAEA